MGLIWRQGGRGIVLTGARSEGVKKAVISAGDGTVSSRVAIVAASLESWNVRPQSTSHGGSEAVPSGAVERTQP